MWFVVISWIAISYTVLSLIYVIIIHRRHQRAKQRALKFLVAKTNQHLMKEAERETYSHRSANVNKLDIYGQPEDYR
jgi:hypothetical protein